jgi:hypothetical protein
MGNLGAIHAFFDRNRMGKCVLTFSFLSVLMIYYLMYLACYNVWTLMAFNSTFSGNLNDAYFFYMNTLELLSFIFVRTRSSIKYLPKILTLANISFLMYVNGHMYACQFEALNLLQNFSFAAICFFLLKFELDAVMNWNPFGTWTPSESNPRCGYHHMLLSSEYSIGFDIFTMTMPLRFRETFAPQSQSSFDILS